MWCLKTCDSGSILFTRVLIQKQIQTDSEFWTFPVLFPKKIAKNGTANAICDTGYRSKERPFKAWFNQPICGGKWVFYPWIEDKTFGKSSMSKVHNGCFLFISISNRTLKFPSVRKDLNLFLMEDLTSYFLFWNYSTKKFLRNTRVLLLKFC